jgi:hypothetical protein
MLGAMTTLTSETRSACLDCVVSRRIPRPQSNHMRPEAGHCIELPANARVVLDAPFEPVPGGWRTSARLIGRRRGPDRHERVDIALTWASPTAAELHVFPHSAHSARWSAGRLRRYFRFAHAAADALADRLNGALDSPVAGASTMPSPTAIEKELIHGLHP